jgi:predicted AAA+ superfamily ATPase
MKNRYIRDSVLQDLEKKMVFIGGPRQVGKTTFATNLVPKKQIDYLNWDIKDDRARILKDELGTRSLIVFDEIHKYKKWRNYLKGYFDQIKFREVTRRILVTGSARLDLYRFGGDSLQGRYHYYRLLPLSLKEIGSSKISDLSDLMKYSGFPEPFFSQSEKETRRWTNEYHTRFLREDIRDLEPVKDIGTLELLVHKLPEHVGSPLSINNLREVLDVSHQTVSNWLNILERLYGIFRISPYGPSKARAVKKEQKAYFYNWTVIEDLSIRFENLVAVHLLKYANFIEDTQGYRTELRFFRDRDSREVDFVLLQDKKVILMVECKLSDREISPSLRYLKQHHPEAAAWQISLQGTKDYLSKDGIRAAPASELLRDLI